MRRAKAIPVLGLTAILLLPGPRLNAAQVSGSIFVSGGTNEVDSEETDVLDERYQVTLVQRLTLHLGLNLNFLYRDLKTSPTSDWILSAGPPDPASTCISSATGSPPVCPTRKGAPGAPARRTNWTLPRFWQA